MEAHASVKMHLEDESKDLMGGEPRQEREEGSEARCLDFLILNVDGGAGWYSAIEGTQKVSDQDKLLCFDSAPHLSHDS